MATLSYELKNKVLQYLRGDVSLEGLEGWLVPEMHRFMEPPGSADSELAGAVYHALVEVGDGLRTESQVRQYLRSVLQRIEAEPCPADCEHQIATSASNRMTHVDYNPSHANVRTVMYQVQVP